MTKEKLLQTFRLFISKQTGRHIIRKVANRTDYTLFQIMRITPVLEHFAVVIGFKHKVISFVHTTNYPVGYSSAIGNYDKVLSPGRNRISRTVCTIVRHIERTNGETAYLNRILLFNNTNQRFGNLVANTEIGIYTFVNYWRGIYGYMQVRGKSRHGSHMVCVVVRNKYGFYLSLVYTIVVEILLKRAYTHSCVYDDTFSVRFQVITVPTASTAE